MAASAYIPIQPTDDLTALVAAVNDRLARLSDAGEQNRLALAQSTVVIQCSHLQRQAGRYIASRYDAGTVLLETDRTVEYVARAIGKGQRWYYFNGTMFAQFAMRPQDLGIFDAGFVFSATDMGSCTWKWDGAQWLFVSGSLRGTLSPDQRPAGLGANDVELRFVATDFAHIYRWNGAAWEFAVEDDGSGYFRYSPIAPNKGLWQLCDGSAVSYAQGDGTLGNFTTPNTAAGAYLKGGPYTGTVNPAGTLTLSGLIISAVSAGTPTGTVSQPTLAMNAFTPAGTVSQPTLAMNAFTPAGTVSQPTFAGSALASHTHLLPIGSDASYAWVIGSGSLVAQAQSMTKTFAVTAVSENSTYLLQSNGASAGTPAGTVSQPTFTGSAATLTGAVSQPTFTGSAATLTGAVSQPTFAGTLLPTHTHTVSGGTGAFSSDPVLNLAVPMYFRR